MSATAQLHNSEPAILESEILDVNITNSKQGKFIENVNLHFITFKFDQ